MSITRIDGRAPVLTVALPISSPRHKKRPNFWKRFNETDTSNQREIARIRWIMVSIEASRNHVARLSRYSEKLISYY